MFMFENDDIFCEVRKRVQACNIGMCIKRAAYLASRRRCYGKEQFRNVTSDFQLSLAKESTMGLFSISQIEYASKTISKMGVAPIGENECLSSRQIYEEGVISSDLDKTE